jgi:hypothetical protein
MLNNEVFVDCTTFNFRGSVVLIKKFGSCRAKKASAKPQN